MGLGTDPEARGFVQSSLSSCHATWTHFRSVSMIWGKLRTGEKHTKLGWPPYIFPMLLARCYMGIAGCRQQKTCLVNNSAPNATCFFVSQGSNMWQRAIEKASTGGGSRELLGMFGSSVACFGSRGF